LDSREHLSIVVVESGAGRLSAPLIEARVGVEHAFDGEGIRLKLALKEVGTTIREGCAACTQHFTSLGDVLRLPVGASSGVVGGITWPYDDLLSKIQEPANNKSNYTKSLVVLCTTNTQKPLSESHLYKYC
jgi:hypothetical protein